MNYRRTSRGHRRRGELSVDQAVRDAMSYLMPTPGSEVEGALLALRRAVLHYSDPAQEMVRQHQAPPPGPLT